MKRNAKHQRYLGIMLMASLLSVPLLSARAAEFHDSHFHLTNYIQEGITIPEYLEIMSDTVGRSTLFGIPLQQTWSYQNTGRAAPTYYLHSDAPLYYYSFTDAMIATSYLRLDQEDQARFDPMITGFNPADMYAADHIRRVLQIFPGVFSGIGEFSVHKEFVTAKVAGEIPSLTNPALDRIFELASEAGLAVILHCDIDVPFDDHDLMPRYNEQLGALARRHPAVTIIWAHLGLGRVIFPPSLDGGGIPPEGTTPLYLGMLKSTLEDESLRHVHFDLSWDELAKFLLAAPSIIDEMATIINTYPERFLFGTDVVAPKSADHYFGIYRRYQPLWEALTPEARSLVLKGNYERIFDAASKKVRAWEAANPLNGE